MRNSQKGFIAPMVLIIIILFAVGGGAYVYKNKKSVAPHNDSQQNTQNSRGYSEHRVARLGLSFLLPSDWEISENDDNLDGESKRGYYITMRPKGTSADSLPWYGGDEIYISAYLSASDTMRNVDFYLSKEVSSFFKDAQETLVGGKRAVRYLSAANEPVSFVQDGTYSYYISYVPRSGIPDKYLDVYKAVVDSVHFSTPND